MKTNSLAKILSAATVVALLSASSGFAQVKIGDNPTTINSSAVLDVESTNKGVLPPRLTTAQRAAIAAPATGLMLYNTTENCLQVNTGTPAAPIWQCLGTSRPAAIFSGKRSTVSQAINLDVVGQEYPVGQSDYTFTSLDGLLAITYYSLIDNRHNGDYSQGNTVSEWRLYVDGELVATQAFETNIGESSTLSITAFKQVTAGTHKVELKGVNLGGTNTDPNWPYGNVGSFYLYSNGYVANVR